MKETYRKFYTLFTIFLELSVGKSFEYSIHHTIFQRLYRNTRLFHYNVLLKRDYSQYLHIY